MRAICELCAVLKHSLVHGICWADPLSFPTNFHFNIRSAERKDIWVHPSTPMVFKMLCTKCVRSPSRLLLIAPASRSFATTQLLRDDAPRPPALPVSLEPAPHRSSVAADGKPRVRSGTPAGTVLKNINFMKNRPDPIAKEDSEYPEWLWSMLDNKAGAGGDSAAVGDAYCKDLYR